MKGERRKAKGERREARGERREARGERRETGEGRRERDTRQSKIRGPFALSPSTVGTGPRACPEQVSVPGQQPTSETGDGHPTTQNPTRLVAERAWPSPARSPDSCPSTKKAQFALRLGRLIWRWVTADRSIPSGSDRLLGPRLGLRRTRKRRDSSPGAHHLRQRDRGFWW